MAANRPREDGPPAEEDLQTVVHEEDVELFYDRAPCGYLSALPDGVVVNVNRTLLDWTGYRQEEVVGAKTLPDLLSIGGRLYYETHFMPMLLMQDRVREISLELVCHTGERIPVLVNATLDRDERGEPAVVRVALLDSTERREYEKELLRAKQRAEDSELKSRRLAETLQRALIPPLPPEIPGLDIAGVYRPAGLGDEVGGDFYDVFQVQEGEWVVTLGDVCGKGVEAAVVTSLVRHTLRAATVSFPDAADALRELNRVMLANDADRFCTVALVRLRRTPAGWSAHAALGGHPPPVVVLRGESAQFVGEPGSLIGVLAEPHLHLASVPTAPGTTLVLFTDGVTEGRRGAAFYGETRLLDVVDSLSGLAAKDVATGLLDDVLAFQHHRAKDDIAVVVLRIPDEP